MSDISKRNYIFDRAVSNIALEAANVEAAAHLFSDSSLWDTALEKLDLRLSAKRLRDAANHLDDIANRLHGPATAFPDFKARKLEAAE